MNRIKRLLLACLLAVCMIIPGCGDEAAQDQDSVAEKGSASAGTAASIEEENDESGASEAVQAAQQAPEPLDVSDIPEYSGSAYIPVNDNVPAFAEDELKTASFETYSDLDELDRCGAAYADIGTDLMPTEKRGSISKVKPSGWHSVEYDIVEGESLYNRCHLIGYQLTAENANEENLITGTRYLNTEGMLPFENMVADYIKETDNHVLYRVTPFFEGDNLVASGVQMEAMSVEDQGDGILFNVYCYNVQPGILIDYATGESRLDGKDRVDGYEADEYKADDYETIRQKEGTAEADNDYGKEEAPDTLYILNTNTQKYHEPACSSVKQMKESNTEEYTGDKDDLEDMGYEPCKRCKP